MERRLAAVMFADLVGYTRLVGQDERGTLEAFKAQMQEVVTPKIEEHKGRIARLVGDGILVEFPSVVEATACAAELQHALARRNAEVEEEQRLVYRIGINLGDIIIDGPELYGDGVNVAARLEAIADPGGIAISASVYEQIKSKLPLAWQSLGAMSFKNVGEKVHVYRLAERTVGPSAAERRGRRRRLYAGALAALAAAGALAIYLTGAFEPAAIPLDGALSADRFRELLPGSEWGRFRRDDQDWVYFDYYVTQDPAKQSGEAYSYYGPCSFPDSRNCLPEIASVAALAAFGESHHWRAERFNWQLFEAGGMALHCVLPDTEDEECYSYVPPKDAGEGGATDRRPTFKRYKVSRQNPASFALDGESMFFEADQWDVKDLVSGLVPEE